MSNPGSPINVAISSKVLFKPEGIPSPVLNFVKALKATNAEIQNKMPGSEESFKLIVVFTDTPDDDIVADLTNHGFEGLPARVIVSGKDLITQLKKNKTHLYLSDESKYKIHEAVNEGIAAAVVVNEDCPQELEPQLRVVFDGDAVIFSDESERVYEDKGLQEFFNNERTHVDVLMGDGPLKSFLFALEQLKKNLIESGKFQKCPIQTYLLTSRDAGCPGYRALNTLKTWGVEMDEAYFLNGSPKGPLLKVIKPHIFFDDQVKHVEAGVEAGVLTCKVFP